MTWVHRCSTDAIRQKRERWRARRDCAFWACPRSSGSTPGTMQRKTRRGALVTTAVAAGAEAVCLVPRNDGGGMADGERRASLRAALGGLVPMLEDAGLVGLVEPLGFESCALRHKSEAVEAIESLDATCTFRVVHDTFHHHLCGRWTTLPRAYGDRPRIRRRGSGARCLRKWRMVTEFWSTSGDRLDNTGQIAALMAAGYAGPVSFEAFAREVHDIDNPVRALGASMDLIRARLEVSTS